MCVSFVRRSSWFKLRRVCGLALLAAAPGFLGCGREGGDADETAAADGRYPLAGTILEVNEERRTLLVDHDEIPGYMPAMTMEFNVSAGDLAVAHEGLRIRGTLYQADDGFYLEQIWPEDPVAVRIVEEAARALRQETVTRGSTAYRAIGENLPDFALYDQSGAVVQPSRFRGKQAVINFIFTRCPDATMCPAATMRMMQLQAAAAEVGIVDFELISITLDPEFDTPGILNAYAEARGIDTKNFSFLTGPESAIKDLMAQLGVLAFQDGPLIKHTLATVLIDSDGKIIHRVDGSRWDPEEFLSRLRKTDAAS